MSFQEALSFYRKEVEDFLKGTIFPFLSQNTPPTLSEAIQYTLSAGGKRIRPILTLSAFESSGEKLNQDVLYLASAVECIHTYSLIHDDLPAMDNDDLRRGRPTCHKVYGEAVAILAGDSLNSMGYSLLSQLENKSKDPDLTKDLLVLLNEGAGISGMIAGQILDLQSEGRIQSSDNSSSKIHSETSHQEILLEIHKKKTGALIVSSLLLGNRLARDGREKTQTFREYGEEMGLLFQITDDILDIEGTHSELGKTPGKDLAQGKLTFVSVYGLDGAKTKSKQSLEKLLDLSQGLGTSSDFFREMALTIAQRKS